MSTLFQSKRPRPRPHVTNKTASADGILPPSSPPPVGTGQARARTSASMEPGIGVKREDGVKREGSPGFEAIPAPPGAARAGSSSSDRSQVPGARVRLNSAAAANSTARHENDADDDFFIRPRRRPASQEPSNGKGKGRAFTSLDYLPEGTAVHNITAQNGALEDDEGSDDDGDSTSSDSSGKNSSPGRAKRRKVKGGPEDIGKKANGQLPDWTRARGGKKGKAKSNSPEPISIIIDDSDDDLPVEVKAEGARAKRESKRRKQEERVSLTPPPDEGLYNRKEWTSYIKQAVHGTDAPQQIEDDDYIAQLQDQDDDIMEVRPANLNPNLARFLPSSGTTRTRARGKAAQTDIGAGATGTGVNAASGQNAEAGPSRAARASGATNLEAIDIDDDSADELKQNKSKEDDPKKDDPKKDNPSNADSDDDFMLLPRAPPIERKRTGSEPSSSPVRRSSMPGSNAMQGTDAEIVPSSPPPQSIHEPIASGSHDVPSAAGPDVSVDLRPQTPVVEKILVKVQSQSGLKLRLKLTLSTKIATIITTVTERATRKSLLPPGSKVKLVFDGEVLDPEQTIEDHDIQDEDQVEATW